MLASIDKTSIPGQENLRDHSERINSIDIFRGITIFAMIFVNDLAGVRNIPGWMKHMPPEADGMTFVDLVFPAFLFIVGMAIPFSFNKRFNNGYSSFQTTKHILIRTIGLLVLGILMVNMGSFNSDAAGMNKNVWIILVFLASVLVWNAYPKKSGNEKIIFNSLKLFGIVSLIILSIIYKGGSTENIHWLKTSWWGILGLIGWAYLFSSVTYLVLRSFPAALIPVMFIFSLTYTVEKAGLFDGLYSVNDMLLLGMQVGSHASITTAGIILSLILLNKKLKTFKLKTAAMAGFSLLLLITGFIYQPLYGINKNLATPAWCFFSSFYCVIIFIFLYTIVDKYKFEKWSKFLKPAGTNPLLAYILPSIIYSLITLIGFTFYSELADGLTGIIRSILFTFIVLGITHYLTKLNIKLHL